MLDVVHHLEKATTPLSILEIYQPLLKAPSPTRNELLTYFCALVDYYSRVEGLSKQEATNLTSHALDLLFK